MRLSPFFEELKSAYDAELDDLTTDSAGHDVLAGRLQAKRSQLAQLLPMIESNPEMVAVAFHRAMHFNNLEVMRDLVAQEPEDLPPWSMLLESVHLEPWAADLATVVLEDPNGEQFMVVTACLEYLHGRTGVPPEPANARANEDLAEGEEGDDDGDGIDLEEAGADWLSEQGFDRKDRFSGDH